MPFHETFLAMAQRRALPQDKRQRSYEYLGLTMFPWESRLYEVPSHMAPHISASTRRNEGGSPERRHTYSRSRLCQFCSPGICPRPVEIRDRTTGALDHRGSASRYHLSDGYIGELVVPL